MTTPPPAADAAISDAAIAELVDRFYDRARRDPLLAPVFADAIDDWDGHLAVIRDFWRRHLPGEGNGGHGGGHGGGGGMFMVHAVLPLEPAHFERWLALFETTAREVLPAPAADLAMARARHTASSLTAGMFTVPGHRFGQPRS